MSPDIAARGLLLMNNIPELEYSDLSKNKIFRT